MHTIFVRFLVLIILPAIAVISYLFFTSSFGLPVADGVLKVQGISDEVRISRDENGAVYIKANTDDDVFFGMGLAHAQDRLWQLELQRKLAQGRMSELFGEGTVGVDAQMRTLGLYQSAQSAWNVLSPEAKSSLTAYSNGVNSWLKNTVSLPPEFDIIGITPEPWTELDSLAWSKVFALSLSNSMWSELTRFFAEPYLTAEQSAQLFSGYPKQAPVTVTQSTTDAYSEKSLDTLTAMVELQQEFQQRFKIGGQFVGSNAWAVSGKLTDDGQAILAGDPHLGIQVPSIWYMANLEGGKINASGMTIVGLPVIIFGRNQHLTWGGTNMMADVQDLYFEQVNSTNAKQYRHNDQWLEFETRKEFIKVRPESPLFLREPNIPVEVMVRTSVHGPVISDAFGVSDQPVALRWTALDKDDTTYESFFRLNYASDWDSFKGALSHHVAPTLNILYADNQGNIGYLGAGRVPIRAKGNGVTPVVGGNGDYEWTGSVPVAHWPQSYNPEQGYIISANNKVVDDSYAYHISYDWAPPARANRIEQLIKQGLKTDQTLSMAYMQKMQGDTVSFGATGLHKLLKAAPMKTEDQKEAQQFVAQWDGDMALGSQGASIFYGWARHLRRVLFGGTLSAPFGRERQNQALSSAFANTTYDQVAAALTDGSAQWCDDINTDKVENCDSAMRVALNDAIKELSDLAGSDMDDWEWGELHTTVYSHKPFSEVNLLRGFFERRVASGGGPNTINVATANFVESRGFEQRFGAGFRQIISLGSKGVKHVYMNSTGQSGNVFSEHYDDMVEPFSQVEFIDLTKAKIGTETLVLKSHSK
ncbi:MAG: penicillin amidase [Phenylobacterium sp.]|jgi:penicillin amidase